MNDMIAFFSPRRSYLFQQSLWISIAGEILHCASRNWIYIFPR